MGLGAQKFQRLTLLLHGVIGGRGALYLNGLCLQLEGLLGLGGQHQLTGDDEGSTNVLLGNILIILQLVRLDDDLQILEGRAVVQLDEAEGIGGADGAAPAADGDGLTAELCGVIVQLLNFNTFHSIFLSVRRFARIISTIIYYHTTNGRFCQFHARNLREIFDKESPADRRGIKTGVLISRA